MLLPTAFALFAGLIMTRIFKKLNLKMPDVTAFLIAGVLVGPFALGALKVPVGFPSMEALDRVSFLSTVALGFIAFVIGNEFRLAQNHRGRFCLTSSVRNGSQVEPSPLIFVPPATKP